MKSVRKTPRKVRCSDCREFAPAYEVMSLGSTEEGYRSICSHCYNAAVAELNSLHHFQKVKFEPLTLKDCTGKRHKFHFRTYLFGTGVSLTAFEVRDGEMAGYRCRVIGSPETDLFVLFGQLVEKLRRLLAVKFLDQHDRFGMSIARHGVQGVVGYDAATEGYMPLVTIDGREISWENLGMMMMTFEGFQFRLEIRDLSEEF